MSELAERLARLSPEKRERLIRQLQARAPAPVQPSEAAPRGVGRASPLTEEQERLWLADRLDPGTPANNIAITARLGARLDRRAIEAAIPLLVQRHDVLRVAFGVEQGRPVMRSDSAPAVPCVVCELGHVPHAESDPAVLALVAAELRHRFDLSAGPLARVLLLGVGEAEDLLILTAHHIISDGWSLWVLARDLGAIYQALVEGRDPVLPPAPSFLAFVEARRAESRANDGALAYWTRQLAGAPSTIAFPADRRRPAEPAFTGVRRPFAIGEADTALVRALARETAATPFMVMVTAFVALLGRFTGQSDLVVGIPIAGRDVPGTEAMTGLLANNVLLRTRTSAGGSFRALLEHVRTNALDAYSHGHVSLAHVIEAVSPKRSRHHTPFLQSMVTNPPGLAKARFGGVTAESFPVDPGIASLDLSMLVYEDAAAWHGLIEAATDLFDPQTADDLVASYQALLRAGVARPDDPVDTLPLVGRVAQVAAERASRSALAVGLVSTFPIEPLDDVLKFWCDELRWDARIDYAPFGQVIPQLLDPACACRRHKDDMNVALIRMSDWLADGPDGPDRLHALVNEFAGALRACGGEGRWLVCLCRNDRDVDSVRIEIDRLCEAVSRVADVRVIDADDFIVIGTTIARWVVSTHQPPAKAVVVDCDNTLWRGVVGEDGPLEVVVDEPRRVLQQGLVALAERGVLIGVVSRNSEADVADVFDRHPDMVLKRRHVAAWRVGWQPKSALLEHLAEDLSRALDNIVFLDDDPVACADVRAAWPDIVTIQLPEEPQALARVLDHVWSLDANVVTGEDRNRVHHAARERRRRVAQAEAPTFQAFLDGLQLRVTCAPLDEGDMARAAQLTWRVNQFNATTRRRSPAELRALIERGAVAIGVRVADRFGDYGLVGLSIFTVEAQAMVVDTLLLSCRVLGRGVEPRLLQGLTDEAAARGLARVDVPFHATARNAPMLQFLEGVEGGVERRDARAARLYSFVAGCDVRSRAGAESLGAPQAEAEGPTPLSERRHLAVSAEQLARIATELATIEQIRAAMSHRRPWSPRPPAGVAPYEPPRTPLECQIADVWTEVLRVDRIGRHDSFFDLGGHSLLAVKALDLINVRVRADVPLRGFLAAPTIAALADAIEGRSTEPASGSLDLVAESRLDPAIVPVGPVPESTIASPAVVFLTGATGFVGARLLQALLERTDAEVRCLVRASTTDDAQARLDRHLSVFGFERLDRSRIVAVPGDLSQPRFGLEDEHFGRIAEETDAVVHCGAIVNFAYPYANLKAANVRGTEEVLRLASRGRPKAIHAISTVGVLSGLPGPWREDEAPDRYDGLALGYFESKWVAERLTLAARTRGLVVNTYRVGVVGADSVTGRRGESDMIGPLLQAVARLGMMPDVDVPFDLTPVDYVANAVVEIARQSARVNGIYHVVNPQPALLVDLARWMAALGVAVRRVPIAEWQAMLDAIPGVSDPFLPLIAGAFSRRDSLGAGARIDCARTSAALSRTDVTCPPVSQAVIAGYLR